MPKPVVIGVKVDGAQKSKKQLDGVAKSADRTEKEARGLEKAVGKGYGKLLQLYGVYKAQAEARRKGYTTRRQSLKDGSIKLVIGGVR